METSPVACREIFDENSQPSQEEITDYAHQIGIDPASESHLLPLAKDGLMQALPPPWKAYLDEKLKTHYYYNRETGVTQWEHPLDRVYRSLVVRARAASDRDLSMHTDTCASVQELLTFEENSKIVEKVEVKADSPEEEFSTDSDESKSDLKFKSDGQFKRPPVPPQRPNVLAPLGNRPMGTFNPLLGINERKLSELRASPLRRSMDGSFPSKTGLKDRGNSEFSLQGAKGKSFEKPPLFKQHSEIIDLSIKLGERSDEVGFGLMQTRSDKGISITGAGSMFLKRAGSQLPSPQTENSLAGDPRSEPPRGILRDVADGPERKESRQEASVEEDRKSVRFNLDRKEAEILQEFSLSPSSNSSSDQQDKQSSIISNVGSGRTLEGPPDGRSYEETVAGPSDLKIDGPVVPRADATARISNENLAELPPRPTRNLKLTPLGRPAPVDVRRSEWPREPPLRPKIFSKQDSLDQEDKQESLSASSERSERRDPNPLPPGKRLLRPPAADFIKPNLFQKQFDKIADIIKPMSLDTDSESEVKSRPRSPMIPQKNKISINLMESIESETSIDSPDKEFANLDLNDISEPIQPKPDIDKAKQKLSLKLTDSQVASPVNSPTLRVNQEKKLRIQQMEANIEVELKKMKEEVELKKATEEQRLRQGMEEFLRNMKNEINREQQVETDKLKIRLMEQHESHKMEIEKAISNAQEQHRLSLQHVTDNMQLKLVAEREDAIREVQERQRRETDGIIAALQRQHEENVQRIRDEKAEELSREKQKIEQDNARALRELRDSLTASLEAERARQLTDNRRALDKLRADHDALCDEIKNDYRSEVELLRSQHSCHLAELRSRLAGERESERRRRAEGAGDDKRHLEDKYRCLKEKYARLKSDVEKSIERRKKRREQSMTTGSETEKSNSHKAAQALEKSKELNEPSTVMSSKSEPVVGVRAMNNNPVITYQNDNHKKSSHNNNSSETEAKDRLSKMHLAVTSKNGNVSDLSSDQSHSKLLMVRDISPIGKLLSRESDKYNKHSTDNELSIGLNDTSLSQSESQTVSKGKNKLTVAFSSDIDKNVPKKESKNVKKVHAQVHVEKAATDYHDSSDTGNSIDRKTKESTQGRSRKKSFTRLKSASTSRLNYSPKRSERSCSPVENLRQQLRKLEDLEDQFPDLTLNADQTGYRLRYPFADLGVVGHGVPELEFVAHRALVEREGVRRARASLRRRRASLRDRRRRLTTSANMHPEESWQEERDLTDLEVSLHRTRAMLGEKVIRLRHIENTLRTMTNASSDDTSPEKVERHDRILRKEDKQDTTLSDLSSQSSGFSSTEAQSDNLRHAMKREVSGAAIYEQSSEIINSLENLNTEIRDIWQVLNLQQRQNIAKAIPPGQVLYSDLNYPLLGMAGMAGTTGMTAMTSHQRMATPPLPGMSTIPLATAVNPVEVMVPMGGGNTPGPHNIPTLADRLHTYRQLTNARPSGVATVVTTSGSTVPGGVATSLVERTKDLRDWLKQQASL